MTFNKISTLTFLSLLIAGFKANAQDDGRAFKTMPIRDSLYVRVGKQEAVFGN